MPAAKQVEPIRIAARVSPVRLSLARHTNAAFSRAHGTTMRKTHPYCLINLPLMTTMPKWQPAQERRPASYARTRWPDSVPGGMNPASSSPSAARGVQSGVQIERNRAQLRATETASERRIAAGTPGSLRLGAGRPQVQILSPRSTGLQGAYYRSPVQWDGMQGGVRNLCTVEK